jgi:molybdopterin synthase catalytic subunit
MSICFQLISTTIDTTPLMAALRDPTAGAVVSFEGRVRNHNAGQAVSQLEYQAYPALALATGQRILEEEAARHGLVAVQAVHRTGPLDIGQAAVWIGVAAAHRGPAFDAARAIMERLKYELPVWKKETYYDGRSEWIGPDQTSAETGQVRDVIPEWDAELREIWISTGNDFRGRHEKGRLDHGISSVSEVECVAGMGLRGDRYFGYKPDFKGQVTFFDAAVVQAVRDHFAQPDLSSSVFRRNLIVLGIDLAAWQGRKFRFQGIDFEASEECKPCYWMDQVVGPGAEEMLKVNCRGGLRARVLSSGILRVF